MTHKLLLAVLFVVGINLSCLGQEVVSRTSIYGDPDYSKPLIPLKELVSQKSKNQSNTFYVSKVRNFDNGAKNVWVYWKERNALILWEPRDHEPKYDLVWSRRYLRFGKEIVPPSRFYQGSNFLTLMKDGVALKRECLRGFKIVIARPVLRKRG